MDNSHLINKNRTLLDALKQINTLYPGPLVLFVIDDENRMVGTLTDGDSRRALIAGASVNDKVEYAMHKNFNCLHKGVDDDVAHIRLQKDLKMKLVPVLDNGDHIIEIINLEKYRTKLPVDAVLMAGGKGERLRPLTDKTPKPLLEMEGKPIIDYIVEHIISFGVQNISVTVNYLKEQIIQHFAEPKKGLQVKCFSEPKFLGTIGSICFVDNFENDTLLLMNADAITGKGCIINTFANIEHDAKIGDYCHISTGAMINGNCVVGNETFFGSQSVMVNGLEITSGCVIGAGSLIRKNATQKGVYSGNPATLKIKLQ